MDNIKIFDKFLTDIELNKLLELVDSYEWKFGHGSGNKESINTIFFANYEMEDFYIKHIKEKIETIVNKPLKLNRFYKHIQTFGQDGGYHTDDIGSDKYTFCIYITDITDKKIENAGGDFLIKLPNKQEIISIDTINNRGIFFPSVYYHKGMAYNNLFSEKRLCITWKLELL